MILNKSGVRHQQSFKLSLRLKYLNPFLASVPILYRLKTPENLWFSGVFRVYKIETVTGNRLTISYPFEITYNFETIRVTLHCEKYRNFTKFTGVETMRKLCLSTKFLHQEIMWHYGILRSIGWIETPCKNEHFIFYR